MTSMAEALGYVDLAYNPAELRDANGRWTAAGLAALRSLSGAEKRAYIKSGIVPGRLTGTAPASARGPSRDTPLTGMDLWASGEGMVPDVTPAESAAARLAWYRDTFSYTNDYLRHGTLPSVSAREAIDAAGAGLEGRERAKIRLALPAKDDAGYIASVRATGALMRRAPAFSRPAVMYRDIKGPDQVFGPVGSMKGRTFTDHGFMSATTDIGSAERYGGHSGETPDKIIINVPAGGKVMRSQLAFSPDYAREKEYTFPPGSSFRVDDDLITGDGRQTTVTLIVQPGTPPGLLPAPVVSRVAVRQQWEQFPGRRYNVETGELV
jgi:hypothetical protein